MGTAPTGTRNDSPNPGRARAAWRRLGAVVAAAVIAATPEAGALGAVVHKCADPAGGIVYQDRPCGPEALAADSSSVPMLSVVPGTRDSKIVSAPRPPPAIRARPERTRRAEPARGDPQERRHLRAGMSEGEVLARIGPPDLTSGKGRRQTRWTWMPVASDPDTITAVLFDTGRVVEIERTVVKR